MLFDQSPNMVSPVHSEPSTPHVPIVTVSPACSVKLQRP